MSLLVLQALASGIVSGCVYALVALALAIVFKSTEVVNFAGGELVMLGGYTALLCLLYFHLPYIVMIPVVVAVLFALGAFFDRFILNTISGRRYAANADLVPLIVGTIGLSFMLKGIVRVVPYTEQVRRLPPLVSGPPIFIGDVVLQRQDVAIILAAILIMLVLSWFFNLTATGKALRATSQNPRAAALVGIPVRRMRMLAWGISAALSGFAGVILSPKLLMTPDMGLVVMVAFAAAIIGGFTSLVGCVVGGIFLGIVQNFIGIFVSPQAIVVTPFFVIMAVLMLRPQGLFGEKIMAKKV